MPEEMTLLRNALDTRGIMWTDRTTDYDREFPFLDMNIYRTLYFYDGKDYSVVSGIGTMGGQWGLLELSVDGNEPRGSMTAEGILTIMDGGK